MAEIRQNTSVLDTFERADENPLSHGGDWGLVATSGWGVMELEGNNATHDDPLTFGFAAWGPLALDGDDAEAWGCCEGGNAPGLAWTIGLIANVGGANSATDGYLYQQAVTATGGATNLYRVDNGSVTNIDAGPDGSTGNGFLLLIRRNGGNVEGWRSTDNGLNWTMDVSAASSTYTTGLHPVIGVSDNSSTQLVGYGCFGAGPRIDRRPQIYRIIGWPRTTPP